MIRDEPKNIDCVTVFVGDVLDFCRNELPANTVVEIFKLPVAVAR